MKKQPAPDIELDAFDGNPLDLHYFMTFVHKVVEKRIENPRERLGRLLKCTSKNAKKMMKHCKNHELWIINMPRRYNWRNT